MGLIRDRQQRASASIAVRLLGSAVKIGCAAALCGFATGLAPAPVHYGLMAAYADQSSEPTVTLDIEAADLHQVVHMLTQETGANIVIKDGDQPYGRVNITLNHIPLDVALKHIALSANAMVTRDADGVYVIEPNTGQVDSNIDSAATPSPDQQGPTDEDNYTWQKLVLVHQTPHDLLYLMHWDQDYRELAPPTALTFPSVGASVAPGGQPSVIANNFGPSVPVGYGPTPSGGANYTPGNESPNQSAQFPGGVILNQAPPGAQQGNFGGPPPGAFGQQGGAPVGAGGGGAAGAGGLPPGVRKIYALQSDNSLLILATPDGFERVKEIVKNLDIAPRQIQIKVEFITATVATVDQLGINFNMLPFPGATLTTGLNTPTAPTVSLTYAAGSTALSMLAALQKTHSKVVESPIITTTNNVAGTVQESQQIPYETTTTVLNGNGTGATTSTTQFLTVTTGLTVQPRINSDDTVTMQLNPQVSIPGLPTFGNGPPAVTTESASALRTIKSGETMVLGGLISKTDQRTQNRIPLLSDLPIIGSLFRDRNINDSDSELLIFVTPTIIGDDNETPIEQGDLVTP